MLLNCVVVDDSSLQRLSIVKLIDAHPQLTLVAEYRNAIETKNNINNHKIDLLFLDIEMPVLNGFELLDILESKPQIIFVTGKTEYALKAFDYEAIDYLHKPVTRKRFTAAVEKAINQHNLKHSYTDQDNEHIFVKSNLSRRKVFLKDIKWIESLGDYIKIVTETDNIVMLKSLRSFEEELPPERFFRVHKSYIINIGKVIGFNSKEVEVGKSHIPLSRNKKSEFIDILSTNSTHTITNTNNK